MITEASEEAVERWYDNLDVKTVLMILTVLVSLTMSYAQISSRLDEQGRRINGLENQLVPRSETAVTNAAFSQQLQDIKQTLHEIRLQLDVTKP